MYLNRFDEMVFCKCIFFCYLLFFNNDYINFVFIFQYFFCIFDQFVKLVYFWFEVVKKVKVVCEIMIKKIQKVEEEEKVEECVIEKEKVCKVKCDVELNVLDVKGQKKYFEKECERELKKGIKKMIICVQGG